MRSVDACSSMAAHRSTNAARSARPCDFAAIRLAISRTAPACTVRMVSGESGQWSVVNAQQRQPVSGGCQSYEVTESLTALTSVARQRPALPRTIA